jgi:hypothetical protein
LHRRDIFLSKSERWADPRAKLLQGETWRKARSNICRTLNRQTDGAAEVRALARQLDQAYHRAPEAVEANTEVRVEKRKGRDRLCVTPLDKLDEPPSLLEFRRQVDALIPRVDLPEAILEVQAWTGFADEFHQVSERATHVEDLALSVCAVLTAEPCKHQFGAGGAQRDSGAILVRLAWVQQNHIRAETL